MYDGDQISAEVAWKHFTKDLGYSSMGVVSVTAYECRDAGVQVIADGEPYPQHVSVAFDNLSRKAMKTAASKLAAARKRGWQYRPDST